MLDQVNMSNSPSGTRMSSFYPECLIGGAIALILFVLQQELGLAGMDDYRLIKPDNLQKFPCVSYLLEWIWSISHLLKFFSLLLFALPSLLESSSRISINLSSYPSYISLSSWVSEHSSLVDFIVFSFSFLTLFDASIWIIYNQNDPSISYRGLHR